MAITVVPVTPSFAAEIGDVDLSRQLDPADLPAIRDAFCELRGRGLSRSAALAGSAPRFRQALRSAGDNDRGLSQRRAATRAQGIRRRLQPCGTTTRSGTETAGIACSKWGTGSGTPTARSSGCRPTHRCCTRARSRRSAVTPSSPTSGRPTTRCPSDMKRRLDALVAEHSIFTSRARLGFTDFSDEERRELPPVPQVLVRTHSRIRPQIALSGVPCRAYLRHAGGRGSRPDRRARSPTRRSGSSSTPIAGGSTTS